MSASAPEEEDSGNVVIRALHGVEDALLALLLGAMVLLAPVQIFLRNFFDEGISWGDPLLRVLVLWVGLLGAVSASRGNRHITIDVFSKFMPLRLQLFVRIVTSLFTVGVCALVAWHSGRFVEMEREFDSIAFSGIEAWMFQAVIPLAFTAIGLRYLVYAGSDVLTLVGGSKEESA